MHGSTKILGAVAVVLATTALAAPDARAAILRASPAGATIGVCTLTPCSLDHALLTALAGDTVLLADGTYAVTVPISTSAPIRIGPEVAGTRPRVVGGSLLGGPTLSLTGGGVVEGLQVESSDDSAIHLAGGSRGDRLVLLAGGPSALAATLESDPSRTSLINSVAHSTQATTLIDVLDGGTPGHVSMVNLTAVTSAPASTGIRTALATQSPVLKNSIVRAASAPISGVTQQIAVSTSNFAGTGSTGWTDGGGNQVDVPLAFVDEAGGDYHLTSGSPAIDAGAADPLITGTTDLEGRDRVIGAAPDIGVYEFEPAPVVGDADRSTDDQPVVVRDTATDEAGGDPAVGLPLLPPAAPPVLADRVGVEGASGVTFVRLPGSSRFVPLSAAASIPVGSTIDATKGHVLLTSVRDSRGRTQTGEFWGGVFVVRQARGKAPYTDLVLTGGTFAGCPGGPAGRLTARAAGRRKSRDVVRKLWGKDKAGRFRTRGRRSVAAVRGTVWLVQDRCDGTMTRVKEGAVVVRDLRTGRRKLVRAGKRHLVRAPKRRAAKR